MNEKIEVFIVSLIVFLFGYFCGNLSNQGTLDMVDVPCRHTDYPEFYSVWISADGHIFYTCATENAPEAKANSFDEWHKTHRIMYELVLNNETY